MLGTVWLILVALAFGGFIERAGVLQAAHRPAHRAGTLKWAPWLRHSWAVAFGTNVLASDQYIAVVLPGSNVPPGLRGARPRARGPSRTLGDFAAVTSPLVPWNSCGAYMAATLGVATTAYVPFAFFNLINPLVSIAFAFLGLRMLRAEAEPKSDPTGPKTDQP